MSPRSAPKGTEIKKVLAEPPRESDTCVVTFPKHWVFSPTTWPIFLSECDAVEVHAELGNTEERVRTIEFL